MLGRSNGTLVEFRDDLYWLALAVVFLTIGTVGALGEWVFHWWDEPWDWASPLTLAIGLMSLGWSASARSLRDFRKESAKREGHLLAGQGVLLSKMDQMLAKQDQLIAGQAEQTALLRELVASFRQRQSS